MEGGGGVVSRWDGSFGGEKGVVWIERVVWFEGVNEDVLMKG